MEAKMRREQQQYRQHQQPCTSVLTRFVKWVQLKKYQYEVTYSLYMLTPTERVVFNSIFLTLIFFLVTAAYMYLPAHLFIIYSRVWYYISGDFTSGANVLAVDVMGTIGSALKQSKEVLISQTAMAAVASETVGRAARGAAEGVADALRDEL